MNNSLKADIKELSFAAGIADTFHGRNCCAALDRIEEALTAQKQIELNEWQPIESAPDNELVLLYSPSAENRLSQIETGYAAHGFKRNSLGVSNMSFHAFATHWMPLPAPPKKII